MIRNFFELSGMLLWLITYVLIIKRAARDKTYGLPLLAICLNFTWELYLAFACPYSQACREASSDCLCPRSEGLVLWIERAWFLIDIAILYQLLRYGKEAQVIPEVKRHFHLIVILCLVLAFIGHATFISYHHDLDGFEDAWLVNVTMSSLFVLLALQRRDSRGLSYAAGWTRLIGNAFLAMSLVLGRAAAFGVRDSYAFMYFLFGTVLLLDCTYVWLLSARQAAVAGNERGDRR